MPPSQSGRIPILTCRVSGNPALLAHTVTQNATRAFKPGNTLTLFGGQHPEHDTLPSNGTDCMVPWVDARLVSHYEVDGLTTTPEATFAWLMVFVNFELVGPA